MPKTATSIQLTEEQIQHLVSIVQKGTIEVRVYKRAKYPSVIQGDVERGYL